VAERQSSVMFVGPPCFRKTTGCACRAILSRRYGVGCLACAGHVRAERNVARGQILMRAGLFGLVLDLLI